MHPLDPLSPPKIRVLTKQQEQALSFVPFLPLTRFEPYTLSFKVLALIG